MWPVTQVNTDLKPPKIVTTEINSLGEKQPTLYTLINKSISYKFSYSAFNKCKVYNIVVESFPWFWLFKKVYVSLIFLWYRYTSSEIRGKKLTLDDYFEKISKSKKNAKHLCTWQSVKYLASLNSAQFLVHNNHTQKIIITLIEKRSLQGLIWYMYFPRIVIVN